MLTSNSRYKDTQRFAPADGATPFEGLRPRSIRPATGMIEHILRAGDRLDHLARHYYNDDRLWWRILDANPLLLFGGQLFAVRDEQEAQAAAMAAGQQTRDELVGEIIVIPKVREV